MSCAVTLPDLISLNDDETEFLYDEIYVRRCYDRDPITLHSGCVVREASQLEVG